MKRRVIVYNGRMKIKNTLVVSAAYFVAICASFGMAHGAENPANGLLMKTFEFGDSGVCAANFIERELDWSGAERMSGFGRVNSSDGWKKGEGSTGSPGWTTDTTSPSPKEARARRCCSATRSTPAKTFASGLSRNFNVGKDAI